MGELCFSFLMNQGEQQFPEACVFSENRSVKIGNMKCWLDSLIGHPYGAVFEVQSGPKGPSFVRIPHSAAGQYLIIVSNLLFEFMGCFEIEDSFMSNSMHLPCQKDLAKEQRKNHRKHVMTNLKHFHATWFKCKLVIVAVVQRRSPREEGCYLILYMCTQQPQIKGKKHTTYFSKQVRVAVTNLLGSHFPYALATCYYPHVG